jgi:hypothetical protein
MKINNTFNATVPSNFVEVRHINNIDLIGFNFYIDAKTYEKLSNIEVICMSSDPENSNSFLKNFSYIDSNRLSAEDTISTNNKFFNKINYKTNNNLVNYYNNILGKNTIFSSIKNRRNITTINIPKSDVRNIFANYYKSIANSVNSNSLFEVNTGDTSSQEIFVFLFKDSNNNVIWNSEPISNRDNLETLQTEALNNIHIYEEAYVYQYFKNEVLSNMSIGYTVSDFGDDTIKLLYLSAVGIDSFNEVSGTNMSITPRLTVRYKNSFINLSSYDSQDERSFYAEKPSDVILFNTRGESFTSSIIEDYQNNQQSFSFFIDCYLEIRTESKVYNILVPEKVITLSRNGPISNFCRSENGNLDAYLYTIYNSIRIDSYFYPQKNKNKIKHELNFNNFKRDLRHLKIIKISINGQDIDDIYYESDSNLTNAISLFDIDNASNLVDSTKEKAVFYTYSYNSNDNIECRYTFQYNNGNLETSQKVFTGTKIPYLDENNESYYGNLIKNTNRLINNQTTFIFNNENINLDLDASNPSIVFPISVNISGLSSFSETAIEFGYDNVRDFLKNCIFKIEKTNLFEKDPVPVGERPSYSNVSESFFLGNNIFDFESSTEGSLTANNVLIDFMKNSDFDNLRIISSENANIEFLKNYNDDPKSKFESFAPFLNNSSLAFEYSYIYSFKIMPVHYLIAKYKNGGLDSDLNIRNVFDNQNEADSVNRIFYDYFYNVNSSLNDNEFSLYKESFFIDTTNISIFYRGIFEKIFNVCLNENSQEVKKESFAYQKSDFYDMLASKVTQIDAGASIRDEYIYGNSYNSNMIPAESMNFISFVDDNYKINSPNAFNENSNNIDIQFNYDSIIKIDGSFLNKIAKFVNGQNYNIDLRFCIVPYFSNINNEGEDIVSTYNTFAQQVIVDNIKCIVPKIYYYSFNPKNNNTLVGYYNNKVSTNINGDLCIDFNCLNNLDNSDKIDIFDNDYKNYFSSFYEIARDLGYTQLYDISLNTAAIVTFDDNNGTKSYYSNYSQTRLFGSQKNISYEKIKSIIFRLV